MIHARQVAAALATAGLVAGCAPDAWNAQPGYGQFLNQITQKCYPKRIGMALISDLVDNSSPYFMDETSRLYYGKIDAASYRNALTSFSDNSSATNEGIDCILGYLPSTPPPAPGMTPFSRPSDGVPPPPPSR